MKLIYTIGCFFLFHLQVSAQVSISTDGTAPSSNAMLDIKSTNRGVQFPRLTSAQRKAIAVNENDAGLMVFDTDQGSLFMYDGVQWLPFATWASAKPLLKERMSASVSSNAQMGKSVAISGDYAAVGCHQDSVNNLQYAGSVILFRKINGNWIEQARIVSPDAMPSDLFGFSVSLLGNTLAIGAVNARVAGVSQGAVYIYSRTGNSWNFQQKIYANNGSVSNNFGYSVVLQPNSLYVGSPNHSPTLSTQGSVYVFNYVGNTWVPLTQLNGSDAGSLDHFGASLAAHNNTIVIGAPDDNASSGDEGSAYVFTRNGNSFTEQGKLQPQGMLPNAHFGRSVAVFNDLLAVGSPRGEQAAGNIPAGIVCMFKRTGTTWIFSHVIYAKVSEDGYKDFGTSVALVNDDLIVGAPLETYNNLPQKGVVYVYRLINSGTYQYFRNRFYTSDETPMSNTGYSVATDGTNFIAGSPGSLNSSSGSGSRGTVLFGLIE